jgi:hypothetical protein
MASHSVIVQWNCRGLRANFIDLDIILHAFSPVALCLQETFQTDTNPINFRHYTQYYKNSTRVDGSPSGGVSILVQKHIPQSFLPLNTTLQATAAKITLHKTITICSIYLPPSVPIDNQSLDNLTLQLPSPVLIMGDFNAHSQVWGGNSLDTRGKLIEDFIHRHNLCILNNTSVTYIHPATGAKTSIDLTLCDPSLLLDLSWQVHDDLSGSDHFPILINSSRLSLEPTAPRWKIEKGDWTTFQEGCHKQLDAKTFVVDNNAITSFTAALLDIAGKTVPKTKPGKKPGTNRGSMIPAKLQLERGSKP